MRTWRNFIIVILTAASVSTAHQVMAQSNFQPGWVLPIQGDTLQGFIDQREWGQNPSTFSFKETVDQKNEIQFNILHVLSFKVGNELYVRYNGAISMDRVNIRKIDVSETAFKTDTVFLRVLSSGKFIMLYQHTDKVKDRYFISTPTSKPEELIFRYYPDDSGDPYHLIIDDRYKSQLTSVANSAQALNQKLSWYIKKAPYTAQPLTDIADKINGTTSVVALKKKSGTRFFAGAGVCRNQMHFDKNTGWNTNFQTTYTPYFSVGFDFLGNPDVGRFIFRTELSFTANQIHLRADSLGKSGEKNIDYSSPQYTTSISGSMLYNFYNTKELKIYGCGGLKINYSIFTEHDFIVTQDNSSKVEVYPTGFEFLPIWLSINLQAGIVFRQKYELMAAYQPQLGYFFSNTDLLSQSISTNRVGLIYHFNTK